MKKNLLITLGVASLGLTSYSITYMRVQQTDGSEAQFVVDEVEQVDFLENGAVDTTSSVTYEYVDLGLPSGTLWATFNVGATKPEEYGDYFAWGETKPKDVYDENTYKWYDSNYVLKFLKYYGVDDHRLYQLWGIELGSIDHLITLLPEDDAATANWGSDWRTPTKKELEELINNCEYRWTEIKGVKGAKYTASNGNSIFIPAAELQCGSYFHVSSGRQAFIFSSSLYPHAEPVYNSSYYLVSTEGGPIIDVFDRIIGLSVRPVYVKKSKEITVVDTTNQGTASNL